MLLFSHPTGNANARHAALGLFRAGLLEEFWTCLNYRAPALLERMLPSQVTSQLRRRAFPRELSPAMHSRPMHEVVRLFAPRLTRGNFRAVYAYEDGAQYSFQAARRMGASTLYDLPIGYWRAARSLL